jgi:putative peptidoglycan lipid II flippase
MTSQVLQAYAFGLPAYILGKIASTCFFAHKDTKTPALIALVFVGIHLSGAALLSPLLGASGIALSFSIGSWINTLLLGFFLWRQKLFFFNRKGLKPLLEIFLISVLLGFFLVMTEWTLSPLVTSWRGDLFLLLCQISLGGILVLTLSIKVGLIPYELLKSQGINRLKFFKKSMLFL